MGELLLLLDLPSELLDVDDDLDAMGGLSMPIFSSISGVEDTGKVPEGNSVSTGSTLGIGPGLLMADRWCRSCLTHGREALAEGF